MLEVILTEARNELIEAYRHLREGFPGRARVCARRSAGLAIQKYYEYTGLTLTTRNAYDLLLQLHGIKDLPPSICTATETLTLRVREDFTLPPEADPLKAAEEIIDWIEQIVQGDHK